MRNIFSIFAFYIFLLYALLPSSALAECDCKVGYADLVQPLLPAVVNISTSKKNSHDSRKLPGFPPGSPFEEFNQFFERFGMIPPDADDDDENQNQNNDQSDQDLRPYSTGSGFIINKEGYIVTNHHVIAEAEKITVTLHDDKKFDAKLIGSDSRTDIALIKIDPKEDLKFVKFGNSEITRVGDPIIAIGNPFGLGGTVTTGIVSAMSRNINAGATSLVDNFIQTDAAINKGNSGGPMFNMSGEVIGINAAIYSPSGGNVGIGFAVPSSMAEPVINQIRKSGKVSRGWLGVSVQSTEEIAEGLGIKDNKGALVVNVAHGSAADKAEINVGDVIMKFDGKEITSSRKLPRIVAETPIGKNVEVELLSKGKIKVVKLKLGELDEKAEKESYKKQAGADKSDKFEILGISVTNITDKIRDKYAIKENIKGVLVLGVKKASPASRIGLKSGDVIAAINQEQIGNVADFEKLIEQAKKFGKASVILWVTRNGENRFLPLNIK